MSILDAIWYMQLRILSSIESLVSKVNLSLRHKSSAKSIKSESDIENRELNSSVIAEIIVSLDKRVSEDDVYLISCSETDLDLCAEAEVDKHLDAYIEQSQTTNTTESFPACYLDYFGSYSYSISSDVLSKSMIIVSILLFSVVSGWLLSIIDNKESEHKDTESKDSKREKPESTHEEIIDSCGKLENDILDYDETCFRKFDRLIYGNGDICYDSEERFTSSTAKSPRLTNPNVQAVIQSISPPPLPPIPSILKKRYNFYNKTNIPHENKTAISDSNDNSNQYQYGPINLGPKNIDGLQKIKPSEIAKIMKSMKPVNVKKMPFKQKESQKNKSKNKNMFDSNNEVENYETGLLSNNSLNISKNLQNSKPKNHKININPGRSIQSANVLLVNEIDDENNLGLHEHEFNLLTTNPNINTSFIPPNSSTDSEKSMHTIDSDICNNSISFNKSPEQRSQYPTDYLHNSSDIPFNHDINCYSIGIGKLDEKGPINVLNDKDSANISKGNSTMNLSQENSYDSIEGLSTGLFKTSTQTSNTNNKSIANLDQPKETKINTKIEINHKSFSSKKLKKTFSSEISISKFTLPKEIKNILSINDINITDYFGLTDDASKVYVNELDTSFESLIEESRHSQPSAKDLIEAEIIQLSNDTNESKKINISKKLRFILSTEFDGEDRTLKKIIKLYKISISNHLSELMELLNYKDFRTSKAILLLVHDYLTFSESEEISINDYNKYLENLVKFIEFDDLFNKMISNCLYSVIAALDYHMLEKTFFPLLNQIFNETYDVNKQKILLECFKYYICFNKNLIISEFIENPNENKVNCCGYKLIKQLSKSVPNIINLLRKSKIPRVFHQNSKHNQIPNPHNPLILELVDIYLIIVELFINNDHISPSIQYELLTNYITELYSQIKTVVESNTRVLDPPILKELQINYQLN